MIYGPEYTMPENLDRLRERGLNAKRGLALREFALGIEALDRLSNASHCGEFMNACLGSLRSRASRSIRGSDTIAWSNTRNSVSG
jgi:hypothetical protein